MNKENPDKKPAQSLREYLHRVGESARQVSWVFSEFASPRLVRLGMVITAFTFMALAMEYFAPWFMGNMMDSVIAKDVPGVKRGLYLMLAFMLIGFAFEIASVQVRMRFDAEMSIYLERKITGLFYRLSLGQHLREGSELNVGNVQQGRGEVKSVIQEVAINGLPQIIEAAVTYGLLWWLSPKVAMAMSGVAVVFVASSLALNHVTLKHGDVISEKERLASRTRNDRWGGVVRVKTNGREEAESHYVMSLREQASEAYVKCWSRINPLYQGRGLFIQLCSFGVTVYCYYLIIHGEATIGSIVPLTSWTRSFVNVLRQLSQLERRLQNSLPHLKSLQRAIFVEPDVVDRPNAIDLPADAVPTVAFRNVGFTYARSSDEQDREANEAVLKDISFTIPPYCKVAIVGASGAGKSTLASLLMRFSDPTEGSITLDGVDLRDYRLASWRAIMGCIAQHPHVFDGTIRDNLLFGIPEERRGSITDEYLTGVLKMMKLDGKRFKDGLEMKVGLKGVKLSGGEAQRLLIAAAIVRNPWFMIIDEATSSLDSLTEQEVQEAIEMALHGRRSAVIIAHRLSTILDCDRIIVLRPAGDLKPGESQIEAVANSFEEACALSPTLRRMAEVQKIEVGSRRSGITAMAAE